MSYKGRQPYRATNITPSDTSEYDAITAAHSENLQRIFRETSEALMASLKSSTPVDTNALIDDATAKGLAVTQETLTQLDKIHDEHQKAIQNSFYMT